MYVLYQSYNINQLTPFYDIHNKSWIVFPSSFHVFFHVSYVVNSFWIDSRGKSMKLILCIIFVLYFFCVIWYFVHIFMFILMFCFKIFIKTLFVWRPCHDSSSPFLRSWKFCVFLLFCCFIIKKQGLKSLKMLLQNVLFLRFFYFLLGKGLANSVKKLSR